jgi:hypothetical protein
LFDAAEGNGEAIDQAIVDVRQVPPNPYNPLLETYRSAVVAAKFMKDNISTGYNIACQLIKQEGMYYDGARGIQDRWNQLTTTQKVFVVSYIVLAIAISIPLALVWL